ncbi:MAG: DUF2254 domain-containing protein [Rubrobacter sp.]
MKIYASWERVSSSFWFVPMVLLTLSIVLFGVTHYLDRLISSDLSTVPILFSGGPSAARDVLSSISGSLITVIGTVFSLTIVAFTLTSGQYTPRMLKNFSSDRGLRIVLGVYIATFVYALLALRTVRSAESSGGEFVPVVSVAVAFLLALVCVVLLIYFIYHVINLIQPSTIFERLHGETSKAISELPDLQNSSATKATTKPTTDKRVSDPMENPGLRLLLSEKPGTLKAEESGYIQDIQMKSLVEAVSSPGVTRVVELPFVIGDFVSAGLDVARIWPANEDELDHEARKQAHEAIVFGKERSIPRDFTFGLRQLTDIALKGLSPSVNDPTTAMQALDRTEALLIQLAGKELPERYEEWNLGDEKIILRVANPTFEDVAEIAFDQARRAALNTGQVIFLKRWLEVILNAASANESAERRGSLWSRLRDLARTAPAQLPDERDAFELTLSVMDAAARFKKLEGSLRARTDRDLDQFPQLWRGSSYEEALQKAVKEALGKDSIHEPLTHDLDRH